MNDPWDVKSVRQPGQYMSCMKLNGVPLLPPVLSKECRKEMQYYKLLAKEVEKRISLLQQYVIDNDSESDDKTDAPELADCESNYDIHHELHDTNFAQIIPTKNNSNLEKSSIESTKGSSKKELDKNLSLINSNADDKAEPRASSPKSIIGHSLTINETGRNISDSVKKSPRSLPVDLPERDYNCPERVTQKELKEKEIITEIESQRNKKGKEKMIGERTNYRFSRNKKYVESFPELSYSHDGPSSLSSKSFTGSLNDLHSESAKELDTSQLVRQRSYTLLKPSPQLLAHLEVQVLNTGMDMTSISMSESLSNISPSKKRRSWDLETAKVKWSSMALELKQTSINPTLRRNPLNKSFTKSPVKKSAQNPRAKLQTMSDKKHNTTVPKTTRSNSLPKSEPAHITSEILHDSEPLPKHRKSTSPVKNVNRSPCKNSPSTKDDQPSSIVTSSLISESDNPASRVRELYEKIQNQQLIQMASLVEKQKKEQLLLQQVFEEQNNLLFKQLKTICPKSPIEVKEAWGDKNSDHDRGPVSLSQLINYKSPDASNYSSPVTATLTDMNHCINQCDNMLKQSRNITGSVKKQPMNSRHINKTSPKTNEGYKIRTHSPPSAKSTPTSRKLNYDTSGSTEQDNDPILTDRTNDTMADLNVTFPSDHSDECNNYSNVTAGKNAPISNGGKESKGSRGFSPSIALHSMSTDNALRNLEKTIHSSIEATKSKVKKNNNFNVLPTPKERAAATKLVAHAKGYLVRRLLRTERVQTTVQTIKDALLCALQLHQDREGIRGADVDLHRRLIQQITAACYSLHDTFITSSPADRCAMISADRGRRRSLAARQNSLSFKQTDV